MSAAPTTALEPAAYPEGRSDAASHVSKRHHFIPRFLLAGFTPFGDKSGVLQVFDRQLTRPYERTPKAVAFEENLYTVDHPGVPPDIFENKMGTVEGWAAKIVRQMIDDRALPVGDDFERLMLFLALMFVRTPTMRDTVLTRAEDHVHQTVKWAALSLQNYEVAMRIVPPGEQRPTFEMMRELAAKDWSVKIGNRSTVHAQNTLRGLTRGAPEHLGSRHWSLLFASDSGIPFVCSDNPISLIATKPELRPHIPRGIIYHETDFILPIHRTAALLGCIEGSSQVIDVSDAVVAEVNRRTVECAIRCVYSPTPEFYVLDEDRNIVPGSRMWLGSAAITASV